MVGAASGSPGFTVGRKTDVSNAPVAFPDVCNWAT